jgi:hypothetical protein
MLLARERQRQNAGQEKKCRDHTRVQGRLAGRL